LRGLEIDLGFAGAGDAEKKIGRGRDGGSGREGRFDGFEGFFSYKRWILSLFE
jgi:hypothetical protein